MKATLIAKMARHSPYFYSEDDSGIDLNIVKWGTRVCHGFKNSLSPIGYQRNFNGYTIGPHTSIVRVPRYVEFQD